MGYQVTKNAAALEWKQVMIQAMQDAKQELCTAEGQTRLQVCAAVCLHGRGHKTCSCSCLSWLRFVLCHMYTFVLLIALQHASGSYWHLPDSVLISYSYRSFMYCRVQTLKVGDLEDQVAQLTKQLETESGERKAAEESVLDLITLHLKVSELRERLAHAKQSGTDLKVGCEGFYWNLLSTLHRDVLVHPADCPVDCVRSCMEFVPVTQCCRRIIKRL